jgi:hypothetical protein
VPAPERVYSGSVLGLSIVIAALGAAMVATTLAAGGGPLSWGFVMGLLFLGVGVGRVYIARRMRR